MRPSSAFGHLVPLDLEREPLGDGRLADAGVADEERVVLLPAREDLHDARDLVLAADERVDARLPTASSLRLTV